MRVSVLAYGGHFSTGVWNTRSRHGKPQKYSYVAILNLLFNQFSTNCLTFNNTDFFLKAKDDVKEIRISGNEDFEPINSAEHLCCICNKDGCQHICHRCQRLIHNEVLGKLYAISLSLYLPKLVTGASGQAAAVWLGGLEF